MPLAPERGVGVEADDRARACAWGGRRRPRGGFSGRTLASRRRARGVRAPRARSAGRRRAAPRTWRRPRERATGDPRRRRRFRGFCFQRGGFRPRGSADLFFFAECGTLEAVVKVSGTNPRDPSSSATESEANVFARGFEPGRSRSSSRSAPLSPSSGFHPGGHVTNAASTQNAKSPAAAGAPTPTSTAICERAPRRDRDGRGLHLVPAGRVVRGVAHDPREVAPEPSEARQRRRGGNREDQARAVAVVSERRDARAERRGVGKRKAVYFDERRERGSFVGGSRTRRRLVLWVVRDALKAEIHDPGRVERDPARASERGRDAGERRRDAGGEGALAVKRREEADARRARRRGRAPGLGSVVPEPMRGFAGSGSNAPLNAAASWAESLASRPTMPRSPARMSSTSAARRASREKPPFRVGPGTSCPARNEARKSARAARTSACVSAAASAASPGWTRARRGAPRTRPGGGAG